MHLSMSLAVLCGTVAGTLTNKVHGFCLMACCQDSHSGLSSVASSDGLLIISAPHCLAISAIFGQSVETSTSSMYLLFFAASMAYANSGLPQRILVFFPASPFEPPLAKIKAEIMKTLIISEIGINHNGSLETALRLVDLAKKSGADVAKFQTFNCELFTDWRKDGLKHLELKPDDFVTLYQYCKSIGIGFASTAFDIDSLRFLLDNTKMEFIKIASGMPVEVLGSELPVLISTGKGTPVFSLKNPVTMLHCVSEYPCPVEHARLDKIDELQNFGYGVGLSDHSANPLIPALAVARGASVIEVHITLDRSQEGFDHKASLDPEGFGQMVKNVRMAEMACADVLV